MKWLPEFADALKQQTRQPDELYIIGETVTIPDRVIPYSYEINWVLDRTRCDYIAYATDDSWPEPEKYARMVAALDEHPDWGAVYVGQRRNGTEYPADRVVPDAYCNLDHCQIMHRRTADRWPLDWANVKLGDAHFWRALHNSIGPFYPVEGPILDVTQQTPDGLTARY
jgi:hypothetical protein